MRMDVDRHLVTLDGDEVRLPLKEFELLEMFLRNPGRVLTRGQLIDRVWGSDYVGDTKTLDVHVKRLRAKLEPEPRRPADCSPRCAGWATSWISSAQDQIVRGGLHGLRAGNPCKAPRTTGNGGQLERRDLDVRRPKSACRLSVVVPRVGW